MTDPTDRDPPGFGAPPPSPFPPLEATTIRPDPPSDWNRGADAHDLIEPDNRLKAMARFAFPPGPPPDEEGLAARDQRWATRVLLVVTVFMAIFNAVSVPNWSRQQAPGWVTDTVRGLSEVWATQVALLGADMPRQGVRETYETARDAEWAGGQVEKGAP